MPSIKKKIIFLIASLIVVGIISSINSSGDSNLSQENKINDKSADIAIKFTKYIHDQIQRIGRKSFVQRFNGVPPEEQGRIIEELTNIDKLGNPAKVTVPVTGSERRFVYYKKDKNDFYKFMVSKSKKRWIFHDLAIVKAE